MESSNAERLNEILQAQQRLREEMARLDHAIQDLTLKRTPSAQQPLDEPVEEASPTPPPPPPPDPPHVAPIAPPPPPVFSSPRPRPAAPVHDAMELRIGAYWFVRLGIVILLTGLVFLAHYAYTQFLFQLGPAFRVACFYALSGAITATGLRLERKGEDLQNYGRVLAGGGLAALYYTTYAAHYVSAFQIIESPIVAAGLLMLCAGGIALLAERRASETMAVFGLFLAFYTSALSRMAGFTLFSNLVLALVGMFLLLRHGWLRLAFVCLFGAFGVFGFWRFVVLDAPFFTTETRWAIHALFLALYWAIFTAGAWWTDAERLNERVRLAFTTLTNGLAYTFLALTLALVGTYAISTLSLIAAGLLAALGLAASRRSDAALLTTAYSAQALLLLTVGLVTRFSGTTLALLLGLQSAFLLLAWSAFPRREFRVAALLSAVLSLIITLPALEAGQDRGVSAGLALLYLGMAAAAERWASRVGERRGWMDGTVYAGGAALVMLLLPHGWVPPNWQPALYGAAAVALTFSYPLSGARSWVLAGQLLLAACFLGFFHFSMDPDANPWILAASPVFLSIVGLGLSHLLPPNSWLRGWSAGCRLAAGFLFALWVERFVPERWVFLTLAASAWGLAQVGGGGMVRGGLVLLLDLVGVWAALRGLFASGAGSPADLLAWFLVLSQAAVFRHFPESEDNRLARLALTYAGLAGIWLHASRWADVSAIAPPLTAVWSLLVLAYLGAGFLLRTRAYRQAGLIILALSLGRLVVVDLWQHGTLVRIVSVMVTGLVLLLLGYLYNRHQDALRKWM